ncbi:MAG: phosphoglucosamine mutase, partial [Clostridia bacterium]|nr:phosphoglucosamine mutase [Clostridia bacterium]
NPFYDNGIKILNGEGEKMEDSLTNELEEYLDGKLGEIPYATGDKIGRAIDHAAGRNRYIGYLISLATHSYRGIKIGLDAANGSTWMIAKNVFETLGAETYVIHNTPNGTNINENCGSTHIAALQELVKEKHLDIGFAFDGDADRLIAVDDRGEVVDGDTTLYLAGRYMHARGKLTGNTVVTTVMSNLGLYKAFDREGIAYKKTDVGDRFVYEAMKAGGYLLGGEQSGHIIFSKYAATGDGMLTAIKLMQVFLDEKQPVSKLREGFTVYPQLLRNVRVTDKAAVLKDEKVLAAAKKAEEILGDDGRVLLRKSGTEPLVRVMVEAKTQEICEELCDLVVNAIKEGGYEL